jgi:hypothetical protein
MMKKIVLFAVLLNLIFACTELPRHAFSWSNNELNTGLPFTIGGYEAIQANLPLTDAQLEQLRQDSLAYLHTQYGIPIQNAAFNHTTKNTLIPEWGLLQTVYFADCYRLDMTTVESYMEKRDKIFLTVAEFTFFTSNTSKVYGGKFGALYADFGAVATVQSGDSISYGYYYLFEHHDHGSEQTQLRRILFKGKFPTRSDTPFRPHEEQYLVDEHFGNGTGILEQKAAVVPSGKFLTQFDSIWKFPDTNEFYSNFGL